MLDGGRLYTTGLFSAFALTLQSLSRDVLGIMVCYPIGSANGYE